MRYFPGALLFCATRRRLVALAATLVVATGAVAVPLANADDLHDKQSQVRRDIKHAESDLDEASAGMRRAAARLAAAKAELSTARAHLDDVRARLKTAKERDAEMAQRLVEAQQRLDAAQVALAEGQARAEAQRTMVRDTVSSLYEQGDPQLIAFSNLLQAGSTEELTRREALNESIVGREAQVYGELEDAEQELAARENEVQAATDQVAAERQAAADNLAEMKKLTREAEAAERSVRALVADREDAQRQAKAESKRAKATLAKLRDREERIRQQIIEEQRRAGGGITADPGGFLLPPVTGPVTSPYGYRIHPIYGYWGLHNGTDFGVSCGEGMRAAGTGVVTQRYWSDVYGNRLYVSLGSVNGKNLTVVYNHASGYRVDVGDRVQRGDIVGYVGDTGWSTGCHLHFMVLVNGTPVDPENWL
ncbi:hypothetical protein GCM10022215_19440 [Nocardioides fonticola]|uniref:M23ase beta-sheet core domain-containing protein n=1 Tax=Nocardioides fonticola TaxID=450363 RepID=A0ABP7XI06_9ACTN